MKTNKIKINWKSIWKAFDGWAYYGVGTYDESHLNSAAKRLISNQVNKQLKKNGNCK